MLDPRWIKVLRDLWFNRTRTILVVVSIAVGIFAVGTVQQIRAVLMAEMQAVFQASSPAHITITAENLDETMLEGILRSPQVAAVEGRTSLNLKVEIAPDIWETFSLSAFDEFQTIEVGRIFPVTESDKHPEFGIEQSRWPTENEVLLESSSLDAADVLPSALQVGDRLRVKTANDRIRQLQVSGAAYSADAIPAAFVGAASGFVDRDTLVRLGGGRDYSQVLIRVQGTPQQLMDKGYIEEIAAQLEEKIENSGRGVGQVNVAEPGQVGLQDLFDSLGLLLTPLGILALLLSGFLVINTISALMAQQTRQIGIMKSIGGTRRQITVMYLSAVVSYSVVALALAIPLTIVVAGALGRVVGGFLNLSLPRFALEPNVLLLQISVGLFTPLLAALVPVIKGTATTVREAISDYGVGQQGGRDRIGEFFSRLRALSQPVQLSLRNTFRRQARLVLTLITLVLGGMLFMTVGSVRNSLGNLIEQGISYNQFDIQIGFKRTYRTAKIEQILRAVNAVTVVEGWLQGQAIPIRTDGSEGTPLTVTALPSTSVMVQPTLLAGRWLLPEDQNAIVVSQKVLADEPELGVGDRIQLDINGREQAWIVVGIAQVLSGPPNVIPAYVNYPYFARYTRNTARSDSFQVLVSQKDADSINAAVDEVQGALDANGIEVASVFTIERLRRITGGFFDVVVYLLLAMAVLIAVVGALGLMGTMSTNVLERTREIGIMRAIGASDGAIQRIVIAEGILIGLISWLIGGLLAYPVGLLLSNAVGTVLFQTNLPYTFSGTGVITWLVIVTILATVASFLPAWNASRLTVREVLAYE